MLSLIDQETANQVGDLSDRLQISVREVVARAVETLAHSGIERHRRKIRDFWENLSPEERKERASKAAKASWEKRRKKDPADAPNADEQPPAAAKKAAGS